MKEITLENIKGSDLPFAWVQRIGVRPDELVSVTIRPAEWHPVRPSWDEKAIQELLHNIATTPVLDPRTPEEIIGYDENGLPT